MMTKRTRVKLRRLWLRHIRPLGLVLLIVCTFRSAVADWNDVPTGSMLPTIVEGDRIAVNKLAYDLKVPFTSWRVVSWSEPHRGDVIVFWSPDDGIRLVKRVVAVPGDTIQMDGNRLFINNEPAEYNAAAVQDAPLELKTFAESIAGDTRTIGLVTPRNLTGMATYGRHDIEPITLAPGQFWVMGDNRDNSKDSRYFGPVDRGLVIGEAFGVAISFDHGNLLKPRWGRFFRGLE
jgi:signal peptidase I